MSDVISRRVGTGISYGALPRDEHAALAVKQAISGLPPGQAVGSVLLFLTEGYAHKPQEAVRLAAAAAGTPQVFGCCAIALLTEADWILDAEGAVAMVLPPEFALRSPQLSLQRGQSPKILLTLTSPNAATIAVNQFETPQFGAICSDQYGHGPYSIWHSGRIVEREYTHLDFGDCKSQAVVVAEGVRRVSPVMQINQAEGHTISQVGELGACDNLDKHLPANLVSLNDSKAHNLLCAVAENNSVESIEQGHYKLLHIVALDRQRNRIHLSGSARAGRQMFWALRDEQHAQQVMRQQLKAAADQLGHPPVFGMMFPNIGRGPEFYDGAERDLQIFREMFPATPMIGFYGNGEIAPGHQLAALIRHYSTVVALFA
ncbi:MAG: hypothetical protein HKN50_10060 [Gammaproteobacteria bacterium]|nr:hypothetical protein [Gammaproteobacteria bacterium]